MPNKITTYAQMAEHVTQQITKKYKNWTDFLTTAARLYKYPYYEQLMIYAQRPDATVCAEYELWNDQMRRHVKRGSKGIALIDASGDKPRLRYVFDIADTGGGENSRRPFLWELRQEHEVLVTTMLEREYEVSGADGLAEQLQKIASQIADEYWMDNRRNILYNIDDSYLEEYDEFNVGAALLEACKESKSSEPVEIGQYRGLSMYLSFDSFDKEYRLTLKGAMSHSAVLGTDVRGNLIRIDNALATMPERLISVKSQLENLYQQQQAAKQEIGKPFPQESEFVEKSARLAVLDAELNMDGGHSAARGQTRIAKRERPSVLEGLRVPCKNGAEKKIRVEREVR